MSHARARRQGRTNARSRGFATAIVLWAVAIAALALAAVQLVAARQSAAGRETLARTRAKWAARAGLEATIARLQAEAQQASPLGGASLLKDLAVAAEGALGADASAPDARYRVVYADRTGEQLGAQDAHARLNVNLMTADDLLLLPSMTEEMADAILDWIDADDLPRVGASSAGGAELETYSTGRSPYRPRNGPVRSLAELELIRGVSAEMVRGEDWNLNGVLDASENDGDQSWPPDNADGVLDAGWSAVLTASSIDGGLSPDGLDKLDLTATDAAQLTAELGLSDVQGQTLAAYATGDAPTMEELIRTPLSTLAQTLQSEGRLDLSQGRGQGRAGGGGRGGGTQQVQVPDLNTDQLAGLLERTVMGDPAVVRPGKLNLNTASEETLEYVAAISPELRDALLAFRDGQAGDIQKVTDLLQIESVSNQVLADLYRLVGVRSNVFVVTVRGRDEATGIEVEMSAEIDRSADPVIIRSIVTR
jgi:type II secretory pathway component PulK